MTLFLLVLLTHIILFQIKQRNLISMPINYKITAYISVHLLKFLNTVMTGKLWKTGQIVLILILKTGAQRKTGPVFHTTEKVCKCFVEGFLSLPEHSHKGDSAYKIELQELI
jgi:hypothetical protein